MFSIKNIIIIIGLILFFVVGVIAFTLFNQEKISELSIVKPVQNYWFVLHRKSNIEEMFYGIPGSRESSKLVKTFKVKSGIPGERPTPLPELVGREYWLITKKESSVDNPETAPYFLTLDIPAPSEFPYGPVPYEECIDKTTGEPKQCDWILPGFFGLHGINGDPTRLEATNPGSSGCVRHSDEDIIYIYNILEPEMEVIRYYVYDD